MTCLPNLGNLHTSFTVKPSNSKMLQQFSIQLHRVMFQFFYIPPWEIIFLFTILHFSITVVLASLQLILKNCYTLAYKAPVHIWTEYYMQDNHKYARQSQ